jgi:hypothetical protein
VSAKSILGWLALAFVVWWVIENPHAAANIVFNIGHWMTSTAHDISNFFATI